MLDELEKLEARVARCEARLDGRGQEVAKSAEPEALPPADDGEVVIRVGYDGEKGEEIPLVRKSDLDRMRDERDEARAARDQAVAARAQAEVWAKALFWRWLR